MSIPATTASQEDDTTVNRGQMVDDITTPQQIPTEIHHVQQGTTDKEEPWKPRLTRKQKAFADALIADPKLSGVQAALSVYDTDDYSTAGSISHENLNKPQIVKYLEDHGDRALADIIEIAEYSKKLGRTGTKEGASYASVALSANRDIADRAYGKATQRTEVTVKSVSVSIDLTQTTAPEAV